MAFILNIETTTKACSVSIAKDGEQLALVEQVNENYSHSEQLNLFIQDAFKEAKLSIEQLDAVAVSGGPGSYTGLRIGASTAKGICYALNIPLISVDTLSALKAQVNEGEGYYAPMIDARRMEVYTALYNEQGEKLEETIAKEIEETSFNDLLNSSKVYFFGDGAPKCKEVITHTNAVFIVGINTSAKGMNKLAYEKFQNKDFEDVAYYEPFYLKAFVAGTPKKLL